MEKLMSKEDKALEQFFKSFAEVEDELEFKIASDMSGKKIPVISTGSPSFDDMLVCAGIPMGRVTQLYGKNASGKSAIAMLVMKQAQQLNKTSKQLFVDAEGTFDPAWCSSIGCDLSRIVLVQDDLAVSAKRLFEMLVGVPKEDKNHFFAGKSKPGLLDEVQAGRQDFNLIIIDSLGALQVPLEMTSEIGKQNMSPVPRFLSTALKKLSLELKKANVPLIMINHVRESLNMYGPSRASSGGHSYHHHLSMNLYVEQPQRKDAKIFNEREEIIGSVIKIIADKNKLGPPKKPCEFKMIFTQGIIDTFEEIGQLALDYNIVEQPTSMSYQYGEQKWVGRNKYLEALKENQALQDALLKKIEIARDQKYMKTNAGEEKSEKPVEKTEKPKKN